MKFLFTIVLALFTAHLLTAQHIAVKSFRVLEKDLDARTKFPVEDQDGKICALIKVMTTETGFDWDGGQLGIRKILQKKGEIWIYVPRDAERITISHAVFGVLRGYADPLKIKEAAVYEMVLTTAPIVVKSFQVLEKDLDARVNFPEEDQNGKVCALIKAVTTETGFNWDNQPNIVKTLQKKGEIWIYVPFGAKRITISHAVFGVLQDYAYPLEIKEAAVYEMVLTISKAPTAVLQVFSDPSGADVYIDGKPKGTTPLPPNEMRIGTYQLRLEKTGFETVSKRLDLQEG